MRLKRDSKLARWAYWYEDGHYWENNGYRGKVPESTSLCAFFWRAFFWAPLLALLVSVAVSVIISGIALTIWMHLVGTAILAAVLAILGVTGIAWYQLGEPYFESHPVKGVFFEGIKAIKSKYCPIIKFE